MWAADVWVKTDLANITTGDYVVVVEITEGLAMNNTAESSSKPPLKTDVTLNAGKDQITSAVGDGIKFVITKTGSGFKLGIPNTTNYIYTTTSNNGIRIGSESTNNHNIFIPATHETDDVIDYVGYTIADANSNNRYFGCYNKTDWRSYSTFGANIKDQEIALFKKATTATFAAGKTMISFSDASNALDLTTANLPSGLAAYKVTEATNSAVTLTAVNSTVAAGTGVILTGTESTTYNIPVVTTGTDISTSNLLVASDGTSNVTDAYVLSGGKFHPVAGAGIVIPAGKAYLPAGSISTSHALDIEFADGETTGIQSVESQKALLDGAFYNLAGQRVAQPTKGMYIVNGKKVIIK